MIKICLLFSRFPTIRTFERVDAILAICLSSLYPLTLEEIYDTLRSGYIHTALTWQDFTTRMSAASADFMAVKRDGTYVYLHTALREWLQRRDGNDNNKFLCDIRLVIWSGEGVRGGGT